MITCNGNGPTPRLFCAKMRPLAGVAQLVEQRIRNAKVEGSTPFTGTIFPDQRPPTAIHPL